MPSLPSRSTPPTELPPAANDASYNGQKLIIFTACFLTLQIVCVLLRFYARRLMKLDWQWDDTLVALSLLFQMGLAAMCLAAVLTGGVGYHFLFLLFNEPEKTTLWLKMLFAITILYVFCVTAPRLAILLLYRRLFVYKVTRFFVNVLFVVLGLYFVALLASGLAACQPFASNWDLSIPGFHCLDKEALYRWSAFPNIITDVCLLAIPLRVIWGLRLHYRLKIQLTILFLIGGVGLLASTWRMVIFFRLSSFTDSTWNATNLLIWTQLEPGCYLLSACLPAYRPLLERFGRSKAASILPSIVAAWACSTEKPTGATTTKNSNFGLQSLTSTAVYARTPDAGDFHRLPDEPSKTGSKPRIVVTREFVVEDVIIEESSSEYSQLPADRSQMV